MGVRLSVVMRRKRDELALRLPALPQASVPQADVLICSSRIQPIATFLLADLQTSPLPDPKQMSPIGAFATNVGVIANPDASGANRGL